MYLHVHGMLPTSLGVLLRPRLVLNSWVQGIPHASASSRSWDTIAICHGLALSLKGTDALFPSLGAGGMLCCHRSHCYVDVD